MVFLRILQNSQENTWTKVSFLKKLQICRVYQRNLSKTWSFIKRQTGRTTSDNEWQRMTTSNNEWYNKWQRITTNDDEWQRVVQRVTTSDKVWQRIAMSDSELEQWYSEWKRHSALQKIDDCHHFNDKKRYTNGIDMAEIRVVKWIDFP